MFQGWIKMGMEFKIWINENKENISDIFSRWWEGEDITNKDEKIYYDAKYEINALRERHHNKKMRGAWDAKYELSKEIEMKGARYEL
jgi:hypothetical protein